VVSEFTNLPSPFAKVTFVVRSAGRDYRASMHNKDGAHEANSSGAAIVSAQACELHHALMFRHRDKLP
jgi:hypothetical protein